MRIRTRTWEHPFCERCPEFSGAVDSSEVTLYATDEPYVTDVAVYCEHYKICEHIYEYIKAHQGEDECSAV